MGEIGLSPRDFSSMTYKETILAIRGYENWQIRELERTRAVSYQIYMSYPSKDPKKPIHLYMPLPSDIRNKTTVSKEQRDEQRKFFIEKQRKENELKLNGK